MKNRRFIIITMLLALFATLPMKAQTDADKIYIYFNDGTDTQEFSCTEIVKIVNTEDAVEVYSTSMGSYSDIIPVLETTPDKVESIVFKFDGDEEEEEEEEEDVEIDLSGITLADADANDDAKLLYRYLQLNYGTNIISSVTANVNWNNDIAEDIYDATGKYPAINCYDFIHIFVPENNYWIDYTDITPAQEWADAGGIVSLMWHFMVPVDEDTTPDTSGSGATYSPTETTFDAADALVDGTWENEWFYDQMDKVADVILQLQEAGIAAIWRPFHEAAGNATRTKGDWTGTAWFWWGYDGADTYKALWQAMFDYFQEKGVHNLIWEWTTQNYNGDSSAYSDDDDWYPGDDYVDMIGRDLYAYTAAEEAQEFEEIQERYPEKMIALSECGDSSGEEIADVGDAWEAGAKWSYFMGWYSDGNLPDDDWWESAFSEDYVITRDEIDLYMEDTEESAAAAVAAMGLGFNLGNTLDSYGTWISASADVNTYETAWGQPTTTKEMIDFLKQGGFGSVRVPVTWFQHMDDDYTVDVEWMDRVQEIVDYVVDNDMYCILNVHHDTGSAETAWIRADADNYSENKEKYESLWTQIAERFKDYGKLLLFEGYNEMLDASSTWNAPLDESSYDALNNYAQSFVDAVRQTGGNNATRNLVVTTYAAAKGEEVYDNLVIPDDDTEGHIAVEVHSYDPWNWFASGEWTTSCSEQLQDIFSLLDTKFVSQGIPVIMGEYGTHGDTSVSSSSSDSEIQAAADQAAEMVSLGKRYGIATFYWMSIFDGDDRAVPQWTLPTVVDAMIEAYASES